MKRNKMYVYLGLGMFVFAMVMTIMLLPRMAKQKESARTNSSMQTKNANLGKRKAEQGKTSMAKGHAIPSITKDGVEQAQQQTRTQQRDVIQEAKEASVTQYNFNGGSKLAWPVKGNVIINFDMDHMVYFSTLDEYRYSNAIAIEAKEDTPVLAAAAGEVTKVEEDTEHGTCVTMRIGPEYEITYGQLKDCKVKVGQNIKRQEEFAKVAKVSSSYAEEGDNLYVCLKREEDYENPLSYLDFSE
ncbi:Peptidase family M23 [Lachnospiraceae bacterium XBB1006]|nr:Peptidase family M23 [Lachnospiraceae bacterium XBB1006]